MKKSTKATDSANKESVFQNLSKEERIALTVFFLTPLVALLFLEYANPAGPGLIFYSIRPSSFRCNRIFILYRDGISVCPDRKYAVLRMFSVYFQHYIFTDELFHNNVSRNPNPGFGSDDHGNCDECGRQL